MTSGSGGTATVTLCLDASHAGRQDSTAWFRAEQTSRRSLRKVKRLCVMRERSSRSSIRRSISATWRSSMARASAMTDSSPRASFRISSELRTGASGPRSSCAKVARNSSLRRSARCRSATSWSMRSSLCFWSETSRAIFDAPTICPASSRRGEMVSDTCTSSPSLRRRTVWKWSISSPARRRRMISSSSSRRSEGTMSEMCRPTASALG